MTSFPFPYTFVLFLLELQYWVQCLCFGGNSPLIHLIQTPPLGAGLSLQWTRQMLLHLSDSVIISALTLLTRIFPAHYPLLLFSHNILSADGSSPRSQKYDNDRARGVLWVLGRPQGLIERVCGLFVYMDSALKQYVHNYSDSCWHDRRGCKD